MGSYWKKSCRSVIKHLTDKFYALGSIHDELKGGVGAKRSVRTNQVEDKVCHILKEDSSISIMHLAQQLGVL